MKKGMTGDESLFEKNWQTREESYYNHWTKDEPANQIQFAFRNHWEVFQELMRDNHFNKGRRCLEVGCGRGSISAYFADAGFDCTLLDVSPDVIEIARKIYKKNNLKAKFVVGDANDLPFSEGSFDIVVSIGLLEHFENFDKTIGEQVKMLAPGGLFLGYIVPKYTDNIQKDYEWINQVLKGYKKEGRIASKEEVFRSDTPSSVYLKAMKASGLEASKSSGIYSVPMISHSIDFPFSLMPEESEKALLLHFKKLFAERKKKSDKHPWLCKEGFGQSFLVWGYKK
ncbi:MAG: class I SAM-dependent methyltransferase [Patescibacteria group bacterium]